MFFGFANPFLPNPIPKTQNPTPYLTIKNAKTGEGSSRSPMTTKRKQAAVQIEDNWEVQGQWI